MGYFTKHELDTIGGDWEIDYEKEICNFTDNEYLFETLCKWYYCEKDMREYSKKHPNVIFKIHGEGEESGDTWDMYVKNGKVQKCKAIITIPSFDETKLS